MLTKPCIQIVMLAPMAYVQAEVDFEEIDSADPELETVAL